MPDKILFLDDDENRHAVFSACCPWAKWTQTAEETIQALKDEANYKILLLDHDLGGQVYVDTKNINTGSEVARWLAANKYDAVELIVLHSMNCSAAEHMQSLLDGAGYNTQIIPFISFIGAKVYEWLNEWQQQKINYEIEHDQRSSAQIP